MVGWLIFTIILLSSLSSTRSGALERMAFWKRSQRAQKVNARMQIYTEQSSAILRRPIGQYADS